MRVADTVQPKSASVKTVAFATALHLLAATESNSVKRMRRIERMCLDLPHLPPDCVVYFNIAQFSISD